MDYVILDSRKRDFQIWISLIPIKTFEKPAPGDQSIQQTNPTRGRQGIRSPRYRQTVKTQG